MIEIVQTTLLIWIAGAVLALLVVEWRKYKLSKRPQASFEDIGGGRFRQICGRGIRPARNVDGSLVVYTPPYAPDNRDYMYPNLYRRDVTKK